MHIGEAIITISATRPSAPLLSKLPRVRSKWPKQVTLKARSYFQIVSEGARVGMLSKEAGTVLDLVEVTPQHAVVRLDEGQSQLPVERCDLIERMGGEAAIFALADDASAARVSACWLCILRGRSLGQSLQAGTAKAKRLSARASL
jgi:hypothetical protein